MKRREKPPRSIRWKSRQNATIACLDRAPLLRSSLTQYPKATAAANVDRYRRRAGLRRNVPGISDPRDSVSGRENTSAPPPNTARKAHGIAGHFRPTAQRTASASTAATGIRPRYEHVSQK